MNNTNTAAPVEEQAKGEEITESRVIWQSQPHQAINFWSFLSCIFVIPLPLALLGYFRTKRISYRICEDGLYVDAGSRRIRLPINCIDKVLVQQRSPEKWLGLSTIEVTCKEDILPSMVWQGLEEPEMVKTLINRQVKREAKKEG